LKFKIDENLPTECATVLRTAGFDAETIEDEELSGAPDADVFEVCCRERRILVTLDLDFANVRAYAPGTHPGIIVIRSRSQDEPTLKALVGRVVPELERMGAGELWIVEPGRIRIREKGEG